MSSMLDLVSAPTGRFDGIKRPYDAAEVARLRGSIPVEHTLARRGANRRCTGRRRRRTPDDRRDNCSNLCGASIVT